MQTKWLRAAIVAAVLTVVAGAYVVGLEEGKAAETDPVWLVQEIAANEYGLCTVIVRDDAPESAILVGCKTTAVPQ